MLTNGFNLLVECGLADTFGRRSVTAKCGSTEHRDWFNTDDAFCRRQFAEATLTMFGRAITADVLAEIDSLLLRESAACDAELSAYQVQPRVTRLSQVPPSQIEWLWPGRVALGAVTLLAGDPGLGKSFVTLDIAAHVSRGAAWPDETKAEGGVPKAEGIAGDVDTSILPPSPLRTPHSVILISAEDDLSKTICPRLAALGADCDRIEMLDAIEGRDENGTYRRPFEINRDLAHLNTVIERRGDCRLVVIDPIGAFLGSVSEFSNAEVRRLLCPLAELAALHQLAVVAVSHLRKEEGGAIYRTLGSTAFVAAARAVWIVTRDAWDPRRRLLLPVKNNLAEDKGGLAYSIEPAGPNRAPIICWESGGVQMPIDAATSPRRSGHCPDDERQQIVEWLRAMLAGGPVAAKDVRDAAEAHGFTYGTLRRAFRELNGQATRVKGEARPRWLWKLPRPSEATAQTSDPILMRSNSDQPMQST